MFHRFHASDEATEWQGAVTPEAFDALLRYVGVDRVLSPDEWMHRLAGGELTADDVCITFDDGLRSQAEHALPVLRRYGVRAFWFAYTCVLDGAFVKSEIYSYVAGQAPGGMEALIGEFLSRAAPELLRQLDSPSYADYQRRMREVAPFYTTADLQYRFIRNVPENADAFEAVMDGIVLGRGYTLEEIGRRLWMNRSDLAALAADGHAVGLHSYDHPHQIALLEAADQRRQYIHNFEDIEAATGLPPWSMSHPLNSYNADTLAILSDLGIRCGFRANLAAPDARGVNPSALELAREDAANAIAMMQANETTSP